MSVKPCPTELFATIFNPLQAGIATAISSFK